jgi:uncharacterized protein (DUF2132 family)
MESPQPRNPMHGITLKALLEELVATVGWEELGARIHIRCFTSGPSIGSSLAFLRRTPWAREKVEKLFLRLRAERGRRKSGNRRAQ